MPKHLKAVQQALADEDLQALRELAFQSSGFGSLELRRRAWLMLLGLSPEQAGRSGWRKGLNDGEEGSDARVIRADVARSVYSWDVHAGINMSVREQKRTQLYDVMVAILRRHEHQLNYFQGFHDIALVFLEVGSPSQAFHMVERVALFYLSDQLCWAFDQGLLPLLGVLFGLLKLLDPEVARALQEAECDHMHFAVPWLLTWFSHSLTKLHDQVMRLFDCLLASHPAMLLYFAAALLVMHREPILAAPRDMPEMVCVLQGLELDSLDVDAWAAQTWKLAQKLPPEQLLRRLGRRGLPRTSPMLHYPHPWMTKARGTVEEAKVRKRKGKAINIQEQALDEVTSLAPVYCRGQGLQLMLSGERLFQSFRGLNFSLQLLGFGGVVLSVAFVLARIKGLTRSF